MAQAYWITFRFGNHGNAEQRYQALLAEIRRLCDGPWWTESADFLLFASEHSIDEIATAVHGIIDPTSDLALLSSAESQEARGLGLIEDAQLYELMPWTQHADQAG